MVSPQDDMVACVRMCVCVCACGHVRCMRLVCGNQARIKIEFVTDLGAKKETLQFELNRLRLAQRTVSEQLQRWCMMYV